MSGGLFRFDPRTGLDRPCVAVGGETISRNLPADSLPGRLPDPAPADPIQAAFEDFHARNPLVYATLVRLARRAVARGRRSMGIGMLWEAMRWEVFVETDTPNEAEPFRLNNNHRSRYARLIMDSEPDLAGIFETRSLSRD